MKADLEADFESFVETSGDRFYRTAYAITRDRAHAEDVVHAALASAYSRWKRLHDKRPEAYVRRMIVNEILGWGRRRLVRLCRSRRERRCGYPAGDASNERAPGKRILRQAMLLC